MNAPTAQSRFGSLDGLRCLAIVPVVWHHATPFPYEGALGRGPLGVDLFFVLSGFLITTLLAREIERTGTVAMGAFYARRALRIFPLYYLVLGTFAAHALLFREAGPARDHFLASLPFHASFTSNWLVDVEVSHPVVFSFGWSLATEEQFYLVWPWVLALGAPTRRARWLAPALFMAALLAVDQLAERRLLEALMPLGPIASRVLRSIATPICMGSLLALALFRPKPRAALSLLLARSWSAPLALVALFVIAAEGLPLIGAHVAMTALVGACVIRPDHGLRRLLERRPLMHVGVVSYGVYLLNVPILVATRAALRASGLGLEDRTWLVFLLGLGLSVAAATVTHRLVEAPFLRLRGRVSRCATRDRDARHDAAIPAVPP